MTKNKASIFSIIFISFLIINYIYFIIPKEQTNTVFYELTETVDNENDYNYYYIEFKDGINIKNFNKINEMFNNLDFEIIEIYTTPNIKFNENLQNKLKKYSYDNIINYIDYYIKNLKKYNLDEEINNVNIFGIKIDKILIYTSKGNIEIIADKNKDITYKQKEG
ncbi:MAG: hypothetical protein IJO32_01515 [Bacilli bacterium]|nr:hypothetical protein [Bacilli bacterium]